jgi:hydrogenase/urease accessory protein HupE
MLIAETIAINHGVRNAALVPALFVAIMVPAVILPLEKRHKP